MCDAILEQIQGVKEYLQSRDNVQAVRAQESLLQSLSNTLIKMISHCDNLGPLEATRLTDALKSDSPFGESGTASIIAAIDARIHTTIPLEFCVPEEPQENSCWSIGGTI